MPNRYWGEPDWHANGLPTREELIASNRAIAAAFSGLRGLPFRHGGPHTETEGSSENTNGPRPEPVWGAGARPKENDTHD